MATEAVSFTAEVIKKLSAPFEAQHLGMKIGSRAQDKSKGIPLFFIDARAVMDRLDTTVGPDNWFFEWEPTVSYGSGLAVKGRLTVCGVPQEDAGEAGSETEPYKAAVSDALKRCAVHFGIGRGLYDMPRLWWPLEKEGKRFVEPRKVFASLCELYQELAKLGGDIDKIDMRKYMAETVLAASTQNGGGEKASTGTTAKTASKKQQNYIAALREQKFGDNYEHEYTKFLEDTLGGSLKRDSMTLDQAKLVIDGLLAEPDHAGDAEEQDIFADQ